MGTLDVASPEKRLILLSFDGLSRGEFERLSSKLPALGKLLRGGKTVPLDTDSPPSPQPVWAEILTGRSWRECDCPGSARPSRSLSSLELVDEDALAVPVRFTAGDSIAINVPLLKAKPGRVWFSDGASPGQALVAPAEIADLEPYASYTARPFPSSIQAVATLDESVRKVVDVERVRLSCASKALTSGRAWRTCVIRLSAFDLLAHLLGVDYLSARDLKCWGAIEALLADLDAAIELIGGLGADVTLCFMSTFSHVPCRARMNINGLLVAGGFAAVTRSEPDARRVEVVRAVAAARGEPSVEVLPMVSSELIPVVERSQAVSTAPGVVYLNRKSRFVDGIVENTDVDELRAGVARWLVGEVERRLGGNSGLRMTVYRGQGGPDIVFALPGVEFHNSSTRLSIDTEARPKSTHGLEGFVWLPDSLGAGGGSITPTDLHRLLTGKV